MLAPIESKVGKFSMCVKESAESGPQQQDRIDAIAAWLFRQWQQEKESARARKQSN